MATIDELRDRRSVRAYTDEPISADDERAIIQAAFESMMLEYPYNKITVTALCERARINKKTSHINLVLKEME